MKEAPRPEGPLPPTPLHCPSLLGAGGAASLPRARALLCGRVWGKGILRAGAPVAGSEAWRLYEYITRHFIATVSHDCRYLQSTISFSIGPEHFTCTGKSVISPGDAAAATSPLPHGHGQAEWRPGPEQLHPVSPGFTEIMPWQSVPLEESLPTCQRGDSFAVGEMKMLEKQTSPPDYLTEAELITLMEKHGIGRRGCGPCALTPTGLSVGPGCRRSTYRKTQKSDQSPDPHSQPRPVPELGDKETTFLRVLFPSEGMEMPAPWPGNSRTGTSLPSENRQPRAPCWLGSTATDVRSSLAEGPACVPGLVCDLCPYPPGAYLPAGPSPQAVPSLW